jgi:hypothetical protein
MADKNKLLVWWLLDVIKNSVPARCNVEITVNFMME